MRKRKRRATDPKQQLINYGMDWLKATRHGNDSEALQARKDAEKHFEKHPEYREKPPFCSKDLYIQWQWFSNYLKPEVREFYNRCQREGVSVNHKAKMENFAL